MSPFGSLLKEYLRSSNCQQKELARCMGWSPSYISLMVNGKRQPPAKDKVRQIAIALDMSGEGYKKLKKAAAESRRLVVAPGEVSAEHIVAMNRMNEYLREAPAEKQGRILSILEGDAGM
ncbi:helix-turn-helix domain-containing protein [Gilvimarinus algae]|uniref:helix-turn-helix domain-containing protein n=1 Tax=Gilvimarinus algae TaxID=3058037 RepID=UPI00349FE5DA